MKKILYLLIFFIISLNIYARLPKTPKICGVIMGISKYMNVPSLQYADRDALSFYQFLLSPAGGKADTNNIRLLLNEKATSYNFFEAMDNLLDAAKEGDNVYIYFAGHGDIEKKTERQNGFLIGYNAPSNCYAAGGSIGVRYLQDYVETLVSKNKSKVILIIDACRSGKLAGGNEGAEITALALKAEWKGVTKILSCQPGETSLEGDNWGDGAGVFTYFMLKGLKGFADKDNDENVSLRELSYYLDENVSKETDNKQMPEVVGDKRQGIAKVDKATYLAMLNNPERLSILPQNLQSAGFETDLSSIDDFSIIKAYERFREYIKTENLIAYNDEDTKKETALSIYRSLEDNRNAQPIITKMKGELLAAMQNRSQIIINNWMNTVNPDSITLDNTYKELKSAFNIVDSTYFQYEQIKFRYLFWSHLAEKDEKIQMMLLEESIIINPDAPIAYLNLGGILLDQKKFDEAYKYFNKASELAINWPWAWYNKGITLFYLNKLDEAIICYDKAIELKPDLYEAWLNKGYTLGNLRKYEDAIKCYDKAIEIKPNYVEAWCNKGIELINLKHYEDAINCYDKAIELKPEFYIPWYKKGVALGNLGKYEDAIKCYDKAIELKSDYLEAWLNKGFTLGNIGKYDEAIKCYDKAIEKNSDFLEAWQYKGYTLGILGNNEEALKCYDKVIEIKPDFLEAWLNKGYTLGNLEKHEEAIKCYDKAIELKPDYTEAWYNRACEYSFLRNKVEMLKSLKKVIELNIKYKENAKKDEDFKEYWDDTDFKKLVE